MKVLGIVNSAPKECSYGGVTPFMRNMHGYLVQEYDVRYFDLGNNLKKTFIPARLRFIFSLWNRRRELKQCDFLLCHVPEGAFAISFLGIPYGYIYHGNGNPMSVSRYWYGKYLGWVFNLFYRRIEKTATIKYTVGPVWDDKKKLFNPICHNVIPTPYNTRAGFIFAGRLEAGKNIGRLISIYSKIPEPIKNKHHFYIAGTGSQEENLKNLVSSMGLDEYIHFLGNLPNEELIKVDSTKKILLMASSQEGLPTAIAEAFSVGVPVISTNPGDIGLVLKNDYNGFIFPLDFKDKDYIAAMEKVLGDYDRFAQAALESARVFDAERITKGVIEDINSCII